MGGRGSGSWYRSRSYETTAGLRQLDVRQLDREGALRTGRETRWEWRDARTGEQTAWILITGGRDAITLDYKIRRQGEEWQEVAEHVPLERTPCNYGGSRPWFRCPGVVNGVPCERRVAILYGAGRYFLCRHCYDLRYETQYMHEADRLRAKAQAIHERLGGDGNLVWGFPPRPRGMHRRTYERLRWEGEFADTAALVMTLQRFGDSSVELDAGLRALERMAGDAGD
ncbi:MAG: hypothetical protein ACOX9R_09875 [Armatimonadota bacterium]|jgi:hypothetical protein